MANAPKSIPFLWILLTLIALISVGVGVLFLIPETLKQTVFLEKEIQQPVPPLPALDVIDTSFRIVPDQQNGVRLLVQGALFNPADKTQATHSFWIELFDANNTLIYTQEIIPVQKKIMGKSTLPFYTEITPVPDTVKTHGHCFQRDRFSHFGWLFVSVGAHAFCPLGDAAARKNGLESAISLYTQCALAQNDDETQLMLARYYQRQKNTTQSLFYYHLAADNGNAVAQTELAVLLLDLDKDLLPANKFWLLRHD